MRRIEYSNHVKRLAETAALPVGSVGGFSVEQVRIILAANEKRGLRAAYDIRGLGCPEHIFRGMVEHRAKILGITKSTENITDDERRAQAARTAALIVADQKAEREETERIRSLYSESF